MTLQDDIERYYSQLQTDALRNQQQNEEMIGLLADQAGHSSLISGKVSAVGAGVNAIAEGVYRIEEDIARLGALADWALPAIVRQLSLTAEKLVSIEDMTANPIQTKAAELHRRGSHALAAGWAEEAVRDLSQAVECDPYHPQSWFNLALAEQLQGNGEHAAEAFVKCARYSTRDEPVLAATAALLASGLWRGLKHPHKSSELLLAAVSALNGCAELHLALAVHHGQADHLRPALKLAPMLALDARAAGCAAVETVAADLCKDPTGPPTLLRAIERATSALLEAATSVGISGLPNKHPSVQLSGSDVDRLVIASANVSSAAGAALEIIKAIQHAQMKLVEDARTAHTHAQNTETLARQAEEALSKGPRRIDTKSTPATASSAKQLQEKAKVASGIVIIVACIVGMILAFASARAHEARSGTGSGQVLLAVLLGVVGVFGCYIWIKSSRELTNMRATVDKVRHDNDALKYTVQEDYRKLHQNVKQARKNAADGLQLADKAVRIAHETRDALERPLALLDDAMRSADPPKRIVPFALPGQLALQR